MRQFIKFKLRKGSGHVHINPRFVVALVETKRPQVAGAFCDILTAPGVLYEVEGEPDEIETKLFTRPYNLHHSPPP